MTPPSVLMLCSQYHPLCGGAERQAAKLSAALVRRGWRVNVLTPRLERGWPEVEEMGGVVVHRFPLLDLSRMILGMHGLGLPNTLLQRQQVRRAVRQLINDADLVHAHIASPMTAFAVGVARCAGRPVVCKVGSSGRFFDLTSTVRTGVAGTFLVKTLVGGIDRWIATSGAVRDDLMKAGVPAARICAIPNGVTIGGTDPREVRPVRRFLYLGRLATTADRDVPTLLRAFARLAEQESGVELAIVGSGDLLGDTRRLAATLVPDGRVQVPGHGDADQWLAWADCFVLPSRVEGMSNALLEAMAAGLPCIANDIPANREVLAGGSAGVLVPVGDERALLQALELMVKCPAEASRLGASGRKMASEVYSIEAVAERHITLYRELTQPCAE